MKIYMVIAAFICSITIGAAQVRVTSIEKVDNRTWMCVSESGGLILSYSDGGTFTTNSTVAPTEKGNASFGQLWYASDGVLRLFYTETDGFYDGRGDLKEIVCLNPAAEVPVWEHPRSIGIGVCSGRPVEAGDGTWVMPAALWGRSLIGTNEDFYGNERKRDDNGMHKNLDYMRGPLTYTSADKGQSWSMHSGQIMVTEQVYARHNDPQIIVCSDGALKMILRSSGTAWTYSSISKNNGRTWIPNAERFTQAPDRRTAFLKIPDGRLLMVKNGRLDSYRYLLTEGLYAYLSEDDGETWYGGLCLDPASNADAPSVACTSDGKILVAYNKSDEGVVIIKTTPQEIAMCMQDPALVAMDREVAVAVALKSGKPDKAKKSKRVWADQTLRVCTYNIQYPNDGLCKWSNRQIALEGFFDEYKPDLVGSQEPYITQINDMMKFLGDEYAWFGINNRNETREPYYPSAPFNPVFYRKDRLELLDWDIVWYTPQATERGYGADYSRFMHWARFKDLKTGQEFYLFNSHFDHKGEEAKLVAAGILAETVKRIAGDMPAILTGDYNTTEKSKAYATITTCGFLDNSKLAVKNPVNYLYYSQARYKSINTVSQKDVHIDHIFYTPANSKIESWELVIKTYGGYYGSDHLPIVVDWRISE